MQRPYDMLDRVRSQRNTYAIGRPVGDEMASIARTFERTGRRLSEIIDAWEELIPAHLVAQSRVERYRAGVIHVVASSSGVLYELDRLLREGVETEFRKRIRGTVARVKLTVGPLQDPSIVQE